MTYFLKRDQVYVDAIDGTFRRGVISGTWAEECHRSNTDAYGHLQKYSVRFENGDCVWRYNSDLRLMEGDVDDVILTTTTGYKSKGLIVKTQTVVKGERWFDIEYQTVLDGVQYTGRGPYPESWLSRE